MTTKGAPYSWEISHPDGNNEGTDISKYSSLGAPVLSFGAFVLWCFCSLGLFSVRPRDHMNRMLIVQTCNMYVWSHAQKWIVYLDCWSIKIFFFILGLFFTFIIILWGFCPMVLLSIGAFLCLPTWSHEKNVDCPHLYHVITWTEMGSYTLVIGVLKYFVRFEFLSFRAFVLWCVCPFWLFSVCPRDRMKRMLIVHTCIMWSHQQKWDHTPWLLEY